jgi:acyl-CoA synthetase (AMP-forming)/AMP-acid ligase II
MSLLTREPDLRPENLADAFDRHVERDPDGLALVIDEASWTRRELSDLAARAVGALADLGVGVGDRVVIQYDTALEDVAVALAAARLGATLIPVPKRLGVREVNYLLERSQAAVFAHVGAKAAEGLAPPAGARVRSTASLIEGAPRRLETAATSDDHCALVGVTSGSTGNPKGVMHSWKAVAWAAERMRALADVRPGESILVTGAGAGAPGFTFFTYCGLAHGATIVRASRWDPAEVLRLAARHGCVWACMVPTMLRMLLDARPEALGEGKLRHMRAITVGGGFMSEALIQRARRELGVEVLRMYAMAECMSHSSVLLTDEPEVRDLSDGRCGPGAELAIFDDDRRPLPQGATGEIGLRGPSLLLGYLGDPDGKASLMTPDGFFLSGDVGRVLPGGHIKVVGRKKDMINRGGYKIDPSEVEELIGKHPAVGKVAVVGYPDRLYGERACAVIEPRPDCQFSFDEMTRFLLSLGLSKEKLPERLELREALPLSPDGKILKARVKAEVGTDPAASEP